MNKGHHTDFKKGDTAAVFARVDWAGRSVVAADRQMDFLRWLVHGYGSLSWTVKAALVVLFALH